MNKTLNKSIAITILTIVALSIIPAVALVIPVKAQQYTITISSAYLNNYSWIEIIITGPAEWNDVTFEVINKRTGGTIELWDGTQVVASGTAKKYASGVFVAYLGGLNVSRYPIYNKTNAFYNVTSDLTGETLVIRVPSLGFISTEVKYDFAPISISFDRSSYPPKNETWIRLTVKDPNWNLDPTAPDSLDPLNVSLSIKVINASGTVPLPTVNNLSSLTLTSVNETAINSGEFRFEFQLENISNVAGLSPSLIPFKKGDVIEFTVMFQNKTDIKDTKSFTITSVPPTITLSGSFSEEIKVSINYPDENLKSWSKDKIKLNASIAGVDLPSLPLEFEETGDNTGVFEGTIRLDWNSDLLTKAKDGKSIEVKVNLTYVYEDKPVEASYKVVPVAPKLSLAKTEYFKNEKVALVVEDPDLNDDKDAVEVYSATVPQNGLVKDVQLQKLISGSPVTFMNISLLKLPEGTPLNATGGQLSLSLIERYAEPGVFDLKINISVLNITEDSWYRIKVVDYTSGKEVNIDFKVVKMAVSVSLDRSTYPLVRDSGKQLIIYVYITDPDANKNPYAKDTILTSEVTCTLLNYTMGQKASCSVSDITETDVDTGVFKGKVTLSSTDLDDTNMINGKIKVEYKDKVAEAVFRPTSASLFVNASVVKYGDYILVRLTDADMNLDSDSAEEIYVSADGKSLKLKETGKNTGVFEGTFLVAGDGDVSADPAKTFEISYTDNTPGYIAPGGVWEDLELSREVKIQSFTGKLSTDKDEYGPASSIVVRVEDFDANKNVKSVDYVRIYYVVEGISGTNYEDLEETDVSSGVFEGEINLSQYNATDIIGKRISIVYRDPADVAGTARTLSKVVKVISVDPVIGFDKPYYLIGDVAKVTVKDMDANRDPDKVETINVRILSDSDLVGITVPAVETEKNSGVFEASFLVSDTYGAGKIFVKYGDKIYAEYKDEFPADYAVTGKPKTFTATAPVGVPVERPIEVKKASFIDPRTGATVVPKVGSMVGISVELSNVGVSDQVFTAILVVKDPDGIVVSVQSVSIPLAAGKSGTVTFSFTPKVVGDFGIEVYIVRSLADWSPLGEMLAATMTVAS